MLRNGADSASPDVAPVDMAALTGIVKKPPQSEMRHTKATAALVKPPQAYIVETLANGKITVSKFPTSPE